MQKNSTRFFNQSQKNQLYISAGGKCEICGDVLTDGWEADHYTPWIHGGLTNVENGQALCSHCNKKKGRTTLNNDDVILRKFQAEMIKKAISNYHDPKIENKLIALPFCGSGKTLGAFAVGNEFYRKGIIDCLLYLVPRNNLGRQAEIDWQNKWGPKFAELKMGKITKRGNKNPILLDGNFGYITTYQAVAADYRTSQLKNHLSAILGKKFLLICDEAQILGAEKRDKDAIVSTKAVSILSDKAEMVLLMTATDMRSDNRRLFRGDYSAPDEVTGRIKLLADVYSSYRQGLGDGYLRPIDAKLVSGEAEWRNLDTDELDNIVVDDNNKGLYKVLIHPGFFGGIVNIAVDRIKEAQLTDSRYCGLITAMDQKHAKSIKKYLEKIHKSVRCLIAISEDGNNAHVNLETYKKGNYDIIISVGMVYIGYDHPPITVIGILTHFRFIGYLDQLIGRGLRIWAERPISEQVCFIVAPSDPLMVKYIDKLREDSRLGILERDGPGGHGGSPLFGITERAIVTGEIGKGINQAGDLDHEEMLYLENAMAKHKVTGSRTGTAELLRDAGVVIPRGKVDKAKRETNGIYLVEEDEIKAYRGIVSDWIAKNAALTLEIKKLSIKPNIGDAVIVERKLINRLFRIKGVDEADLALLKEMMSYVTLTRNKELREKLNGN